QLAGSRNGVAVGRDALQVLHRLLEWHRVDRLPLQGDHRTEIVLLDAPHGRRAEAEREIAVIRDGSTASLDVAEHERAGLLPRQGLDLLRQALRYAAVAAGFVGVARLAAGGVSAFRDDHDAEAAP